MSRWSARRDSVAITGSILGLTSLLFAWLTLKPNRLLSGSGLKLWDSAGWDEMAIILVLWLVCFGLSLASKSRLSAFVLGLLANIILIYTFVLAGYTAGDLLETSPPFARISLDIGFWFTIVAAYILIHASRRRLQDVRIWQGFITWSALIIFLVMLLAGWFDDLAVMQEYSARSDRFEQEFFQHIRLFIQPVAIGTVIGVLLGIWAARSRIAEHPIFFSTNIVQTIPGLALLGLLLPILAALSDDYPILEDWGIRGVGPVPAIIALTIYSLLPIVRNTFVALRQVDPATIDAGLGMGMSRFQVFYRIEVPLAAPLVLEGIRIAAIVAVGLAILAALIGGGGLGFFVIEGYNQAASDLILVGAIPIVVLAFVVDAVMRLAGRLATPKGIAAGEM
ncbi:MAG: ABC transporter permease [Planctomycetes bacterium]|nr:ABC transporter permease [Planctomycetota bacterium]